MSTASRASVSRPDPRLALHTSESPQGVSEVLLRSSGYEEEGERGERGKRREERERGCGGDGAVMRKRMRSYSLNDAIGFVFCCAMPVPSPRCGLNFQRPKVRADV